MNEIFNLFEIVIKKYKPIQYLAKYLDLFIINKILILSFFSIIFMLTASVASEYRINASTFMFIKKHIIFTIFGIILMLYLSQLSHDSLKIFVYSLFLSMLFSIIILPFIGIAIKGSNRWINLGFFALQPSELLKPSFFFINGLLLSDNRLGFYQKLLISSFIFGLISFFLLIQPDFGMFSTFLFAWAVQVFLFGIRTEFILFVSSFFSLVMIFAYLKVDYIHKRMDLFFSGAKSYQTTKATQAIYNGGIFGKGFGNGVFKYQLPDCHTDYIFSVIFEEFGLIFILLIIFLYMKIFKKIFNFIKNQDHQSILIVYGLISTIFFQIFVNIAVNLNLLPSKGMTFPLISYGGSSMISSYIIFGIILNLTSYDKEKFKTYYDKIKK